MKILIHPDLRLRQTTRRVKWGEDISKIIEKMYKIMEEAGGVGLAANQIGIDKSLLVFNHFGTKGFCVNPMIVARSNPYEIYEGCLSLPGQQYTVTRYGKITIRSSVYPEDVELDSYLAQIFQHEIDHLNGRLICDEKEEELY